MQSELQKKYQRIKEHLGTMESAAVAFSGGVDSSLLLALAQEILGKKVIALTARSCVFPKREWEEAANFAKWLGVFHQAVDVDLLQVPGVMENPENRCYRCKRELLRRFCQAAWENGVTEVLEGSNLDDLGDDRPGLQALAESTVQSPLRDAGFTKRDVRELSRELGLPTWEKPSLACLATRIPYGEPLSLGKLSRIEQAEQFLWERGFAQVRVRSHGKIARIEISEVDFAQFLKLEMREQVSSRLHSLGFAYAVLDLQGYRTGSMNETQNTGEEETS